MMLSVITIFIVLFYTGFPCYHMVNAFILFKKKTFPTQSIERNRSMSILIPCFNEEKILKTSLSAITSNNYPNAEVIYINDGSTDRTLPLLDKFLDLKITTNRPISCDIFHQKVNGFYRSNRFKNVYVIDKDNGGKADALNTGIVHAKNDLVVTLDADSILEPNALHRINDAFQDEDVIAAGGMVHVLQGRRSFTCKATVSLKLPLLLRFQILEYIKGFYVYKASLARENALAIISGSFGVFDRKSLLELGGYRDTVGEDIDITLRFQTLLHTHPQKKILFIPKAIAFTECPETWRDLFNQRIRWQKAFIDCVFHYHKILLKTLLRRSLSFFFMIDAFFIGTYLTYVAVFYLILLLIFPSGNSTFIILTYVLASTSFNLIYTFIALNINAKFGTTFKGSDKARLVITIFLDLFLYRFATTLFIGIGTIAYFMNKEGWYKVSRTGRDYDNTK